MNGASMSEYSVQFLSHLFRKFIFGVYIGSSQEKSSKEKYEMAVVEECLNGFSLCNLERT